MMTLSWGTGWWIGSTLPGLGSAIDWGWGAEEVCRESAGQRFQVASKADPG
jgi:hypothetical protein